MRRDWGRTGASLREGLHQDSISQSGIGGHPRLPLSRPGTNLLHGSESCPRLVSESPFPWCHHHSHLKDTSDLQ